jgi:hypothetical protein
MRLPSHSWGLHATAYFGTAHATTWQWLTTWAQQLKVELVGAQQLFVSCVVFRGGVTKHSRLTHSHAFLLGAGGARLPPAATGLVAGACPLGKSVHVAL